jgi:hypothetical protein
MSNKLVLGVPSIIVIDPVKKEKIIVVKDKPTNK